MRRWLAVLMFGSMSGAQLSALACPMSHHAQAPVSRQASHASHGSATDAATPASNTHGSEHGNADQCIMALTCAAFAPSEASATAVLPPERDLQQRLSAEAYANPDPPDLTPPPRLG
jgi:hypothetical protein